MLNVISVDKRTFLRKMNSSIAIDRDFRICCILCLTTGLLWARKISVGLFQAPFLRQGIALHGCFTRTSGINSQCPRRRVNNALASRSNIFSVYLAKKWDETAGWSEVFGMIFSSKVKLSITSGWLVVPNSRLGLSCCRGSSGPGPG